MDVVVGPSPTGQTEVIEPVNRLQLRKPLQTYSYRLFPVVDQIADKVCATMSTAYPGGRHSSRVKDLVDLVVLAHTQVIDRAELGRAITHKRVLSAVEPFQHFVIPTAWHQTYAITAKGVVAAESLTAAVAAEVVASLVDPALGPTSPDATWDPRQLRWSASSSRDVPAGLQPVREDGRQVRGPAGR